MKRVNLFLILLITAITALTITTVIGLATFSSTQQTPYDWMNQIWGHNGGNGGSHGMGRITGQTSTPTPSANYMLPYFGVLFAVFIALTIVGIIGIAYYLVYPQICIGTTISTSPISPITNGLSAIESVAKTLTEDERKIVIVLQTHQGKYLQKYIKTETGLSRLQTHRVLARLADRSIVALEKTGNTNQVTLADWLNQKQ